MLKCVILLLCAILLISFSPLGSATAANATFKLLVTGFKKEAPVEAIVQIYFNAVDAPFTIKGVESDRNSNGHFEIEYQIDRNIGDLESVYILGEIVDTSGNRVGFIPLQVKKSADFSEIRERINKYYTS